MPVVDGSTVGCAIAIDLLLLGPIEVTLDGRPVALGATKQRALLAMLALDAGAAVPVERLVDGLWGDDPPATAGKMVQLYVSQLRRLLAGAGASIVTHGRGYELRLDDGSVDVARFRRLVDAAQRADGDRATAAAAAREALALWRGPALADVADEPFAPSEIRRLEELRLTAAELAVDGELAAGRDDVALAELDRLIADHPLRERLHVWRMLALYRAGRQAEALDAYVAARERLVEDAGVEPGAELRDLHERILRQDPSLRGPPAPPPPADRSPRWRPPRPAPPRARLLVGAAGLVLVLTAVAVALTRSSDPGGLSGIDEGSVGVIDPGTARITAQYHVSAAPRAVAGGAGSVWVANPNASTVSRIGANRREVTTIDVGGSPSALAFDGRSLWVADEESGTVGQIDPDEDRVVRRTPRIGNGLRALAVGHGALWVAVALDGEVVRIGLRDGAVKHIAVGALPVALAVSRDAVWAAIEGSGRVVRIDPRTATVTDAVEVGNGPSALAVGAGAVWAANRQDGTVSRIDPRTGREIASIPVGTAPSDLTIADGRLWVSDAARGALARIDPGSTTVTATVPTGSAPAGLATIDGTVWATAAAPPAAHRGGTLRVGRFPFSMDPALGGYDPSAAPVLQLAYDGLVRYRRAEGAAGARLVPALAVGVPEPTNGGRRYVFRLRRGGRYSDGTPVRAGDVPASLERMLLIQDRSTTALYQTILGAEGCSGAATTCDLSRGVVADARSNTVTFNLRRPDRELVPKLALPLASIVPARAPRRLSSTPLPGTGPYRVASERPKHGALLVRNPRFRAQTAGGRDAGFVDRVSVAMDDDERRLLAAYTRGDLDLTAVFETGAEQLERIRAAYGTGLRSGPFPMTVYAWMNVHAPPFDDVRVRRALNLAAHRGAMVDALGGSPSATPACQLLPPGFAGYRPICPFTSEASPAAAWVAPDRAKAKALVAASPRRGERVVLWVGQPWRAIGRQLAADLHGLGFPTRVRVFPDLGALNTASRDTRQHPQIGINGWIADWPEPAGFLKALIGCAGDVTTNPGGVNSARFCDGRIDGAIAAAEATGPAAGPAWQRIEEDLDAQAPIVPIMNKRYPVLTSERTGNVQFHPLTGPLLDAVWVR